MAGGRVAREPGGLLWRVSAAKVETAGPFSTFPGCDRVLVVTSGAGLVLEHGEAAPRAVVRRLEPYRFSGDWATSAELVDGGVVDFNVIFRRERVTAEVEARELDAAGVREPLGGGHVFVHVLMGALVARVAGHSEQVAAAAGDSVWAHGWGLGEELTLGPTGPGCQLLVVRV